MSPTISAAKKGAKSSGRQTNNSLSSLPGNVIIESASTLKSNDSKQSNSNASSGKANESKKSTKIPNSTNKNNAKTEKKSVRNSTAAAPQKASASTV